MLSPHKRAPGCVGWRERAAVERRTAYRAVRMSERGGGDTLVVLNSHMENAGGLAVFSRSLKSLNVLQLSLSIPIT
jgi:hypothetical protein